MPFNGAGVYTPPATDFPAVANTLIESTKFNNVINDLATALSTCITKDGQTIVTANIPFGGFRLTGVGAGTARTDAANVGQLQDNTATWAGTAGGTADALTLTPSPAITSYATGMAFSFKSGAAANTGAATVAISGLGVKAIQKSGAALGAADIEANQWYAITYDGAAFQLEQLSVAVLKSTGTAKGDMVLWSASGVVGRLAVGTNGQIMMADSAQTFGVKWADNGALQTGMIAPYVGTTAPTGFVLLDGKTIGNAASGGTERANADTVDLFTLLWNSMADAQAPVSGGRGANAAADYAANKTITLPDGRGRGIFGKDDMGGAAANRITNAGSGIVGTTLGVAGGAETVALAAANHASHAHGVNVYSQNTAGTIGVYGGPIQALLGTPATDAQGSGTAHQNMSPALILNLICKL